MENSREDSSENSVLPADGDSSQMSQLQNGCREDNGATICTISATTKSSRQKQFDVFLIEAIDEVLSSLGEPVKNTLYQHLEYDFKIRKQDIAKNICQFSFLIHKIFGLGASRLEVKIMKNLNLKICGNLELPGCDGSLSEWIIVENSFEEYVNDARRSYETQEAKSP